MDRQTFEAGLKRDGYEILTNTTPGAKVNPEHSHPFDVRAMVLKGAITITSASEAKTYKPGDTWTCRAAACIRRATGRKARWFCSAARPEPARSMKAPALGWQLASAFVLSLLVLVGLIDWLQNVHIITSNGMYKSIQAEPWIADSAHARLDPSNYLYFPLYGASPALLDTLGILRGVPWKQFAYLNAFWASLGVVFVYGFVHRVTGSAWSPRWPRCSISAAASCCCWR